jgi:aldo/keto reductase family protein
VYACTQCTQSQYARQDRGPVLFLIIPANALRIRYGRVCPLRLFAFVLVFSEFASSKARRIRSVWRLSLPFSSLAANQPVVDLLKQFAGKKNATSAQLALAWLLTRKPWIVPIPGTRNPDHLNENVGAINVQLTPAEVAELDSAFSKLTVYGGRMNEMQMKVVE